MAHGTDGDFTPFTTKQELLDELRRLTRSSEPVSHDLMRRFNITDTNEWSDPEATNDE